MFLDYYLVVFHRYYYLSHKRRRATIKLQVVICQHRRTLYSVYIGNGVKTANAIREAIVCIVADWSRCNYARQGDRAKVLNSPDVGGVERAGPSGEREGSRHKSDRIFIDAKLAISSPVTIPELCISLWDSRSKVYPSRLFPPRNPAARSTLFHAEFSPLPVSSSSSSSPFASLPPRSPRQPSRNPHCTSRLSHRIATLPFGFPTLRTLSRLETSLIGRLRGWKKRRYPRIQPITVNTRNNACDILHR